jgi:hypothetical protein
MSTVWNEGTYARAGHSDVEQMEIAQHFNTPSHNVSDSSKTSTLEISSPNQPGQKDEEDGNATLLAKIEDVEEPIVSSGTAEPPPDGGLTAWLQGKNIRPFLSIPHLLTRTRIKS